MGLDMYFYKSEQIKCPCCGHNFLLTDHMSMIYYFRKHSDLHGFLMNIWLMNNPEKDNDDFNCEIMEITEDILNLLKDECSKKEHIHYSGFFWGSSYETDWNDTENKLIPIIEEELNKGNKVYYSSDW